MEAEMIVTNEDEYRRAFVEYLRKGTPIRLQTKQAATSGQYVWRTRDDDKVRPSHRANDGHVFDWSAPLATGHPGSEYGCRCQAVPYVSGATEFAFHAMQDFPPGLLMISGESRFRFTDRFEDPVNLSIEVGGDPYDITGEWTASFSAEVFADSKASEFTAS